MARRETAAARVLHKMAGLLPVSATRMPGAAVAVLPVGALLAGLIMTLVASGSDAISALAPWSLLAAAMLAFGLGVWGRTMGRRSLAAGLKRSATQVLPAVPMLVCIAVLATTWMLSGVVPVLIDYGLRLLSPEWFLLTACVCCAAVSVLTGSSWSTIATIGVAFMGIGVAMGYSEGWVAGAIISGAYFGDKVSPLSDTTVVASSTCGVDLFTHIRGMMATSLPAMVVAMGVFALRGLTATHLADGAHAVEIEAALHERFNLTPWILSIPLLTLAMIVMRLRSIVTLAGGALLGAAGIFIFQPQLGLDAASAAGCIWGGYAPATGVEAYDSLVATGGIVGMLPTIFLVLSAMVFGWAMISAGMLGAISAVITRRLRRRGSIVGATVASGICANCCTADQYLSLIITGNMYRNVYRRARLQPRILSRSLEDSISVTSVLIPWNSCGVTQSTVLGVATLAYWPYCIFNYLSPLMSVGVAYASLHLSRAWRRVRPRMLAAGTR